MTASFSSQGSHLFQTAGNNSNTWRPLLAVDPVDTISIFGPTEIGQLKAFLKTHQNHLCAGYLSYDLGLILQGLESRHERTQPLAVFHAYSTWQENEQSLDLPSQTGIALKFEPSVGKNLYRQNITPDYQEGRALL